MPVSGIMNRNRCTHAVPGNEFRSGAGRTRGSDWHSIAGEITTILQGKQLKLLLLGNSITQGWGGNRPSITHRPGQQAMNEVLGNNTWESAGISGDRTQNLLWRIRFSNHNTSHPEDIVIAIGINNLLGGSDTAEEVAEGITAVSKEARKQFPDSRIILLGPLPAGKEKPHTAPMRQSTRHSGCNQNKRSRIYQSNLLVHGKQREYKIRTIHRKLYPLDRQRL